MSLPPYPAAEHRYEYADIPELKLTQQTIEENARHEAYRKAVSVGWLELAQAVSERTITGAEALKKLASNEQVRYVVIVTGVVQHAVSELYETEQEAQAWADYKNTANGFKVYHVAQVTWTETAK